MITHDKIIERSFGYLDIEIENKKVTLCHYPMKTWNCSHWGSWHLYGHHHHKTDFGGKTMNVSLDANDMMPVSWEEVKEFMKNREDNWDMIYKEKRDDTI
jgi:calcineurin-like phosphoesterase family protein